MWGLSILTLVFGFALAGCGGDDDTTSPSGGDPNKVATPTADPAGGTTDSPVAVTSGTAITLATTTADATIYYTTDGTTPSASSTQYSAASKPTITAATTIKAFAVKTDMTDSDVLTAVYTVTGPVAPVWTAATLHEDLNAEFKAVAYGGGNFVALMPGKIAISSDGVTWTPAASPNDLSPNAMAYGNGKWIMGGHNGKVTRSIDNGANWTQLTDSDAFSEGGYRSDINGVAYGNGKWVAVADFMIAYSEDDGETWVRATSTGEGTPKGKSCVAYGGSKFVASDYSFGYSSTVWYSNDGETWTAVDLRADIGFGEYEFIRCVAYADSMWVGLSGNKIVTSSDGETWQVADTPLGFSGYGVAYGNNRWVAVGMGDDHIAASTNGTTWAVEEQNIFTYSDSYIYGVAYGGGKFVVVGSLPYKIGYLADN
jgi:hypothetical protein